MTINDKATTQTVLTLYRLADVMREWELPPPLFMRIEDREEVGYDVRLSIHGDHFSQWAAAFSMTERTTTINRFDGRTHLTAVGQRGDLHVHIGTSIPT